MIYIDTNIAISLLKKGIKNFSEELIISEFSLIELERIKNIENFNFDVIPFKILKIKEISINFRKLRNISNILLDKSYLSDFIHLEISKNFNLTFLSKDKRLAKVLHEYPNVKII